MSDDQVLFAAPKVNFKSYRVFQKVILIENCILYTAFDASMGKLKLIQ